MVVRLLLTLSILHTTFCVSTDNGILPLCKLCECTNNNTSVECSSLDIKKYIFDPKMWRNKETIYPYVNITIRDSGLLVLDKQFPESNLQLLNLESNSIMNITQSVFQNLQNMSTLILSNNKIDIILPDAFKGTYLEEDFMPLRSLKILRLDNNRIHTLHQDVFEHTSRVEVLSLSNNPLRVIDHQTLVALTSLMYLKELDLSNTGLSDLPDNFLHTPKFLTHLNLAENKFQGIPKTIGDAHNLTTLIMNRNPIANLTKENGFPKLLTLKVLHMCQMDKLVNIGRHAFTGLESLEKLFLAGNDQLSHIDDNAICDQIDEAEYTVCPPLKEVYINDNKLTHLNQPLLGRWERLDVLDLRDNPWTCECENQWFLDELMPIYLKINEEYAKQLRCAAPIEMQDYTFLELYEKKTVMRCLDKYGHRPERDAAMLVGILAGLLIAIPLVLFVIYAYQRKWFGCCEKSPAAFSRRFYKRTTSEDYFY